MTMEKFADYILREKIHETKNSIIYRGHKENEAQQCIIKLLRTKYPTPSEIARFRQEYDLIKDLDLKGVIKTFDIIIHGDGFALILEDFDGVSIKSLLDEKEKFDLKSFLAISAKIAEALGHIHEKEIVHKDIKPHNILINPTTQVVKITDFGISTVLTHENDEVYNPDFITGTLAYMSPEQTGRMNRTVDYRTDFYSFGITMYEMLTGSLPFKSQDHDPIELIHSHIAVMPEPPMSIYPDIPEVLSDMVMRLLAKAPEERYQNGFGIMADINECIKQFEEKQNIEAFELGRFDISNKFITPPKLFGREKETEDLISGFDAVATRKTGSAVMVVAGPPGIGKSAMVHEIHKSIVARKGYYISGKYEQFRRDKPYSAIIQAFQVLAKQILSESEERISIWRENLLKALGANGKVITDVIPEVELIIGKQPDLPTLGPEESRNRFNFVFEKFMAVFPQKEHPLVVFLDDLQWSDLASLQFLKNILTGSGMNYFFLILSYRDNEVGEFHQVMDFLGYIEKSKVKINRITLGTLTVRHIADLIKYFLRCSEEKATKLAELLVKKTGGNPFFVNQFLQTLYNEKMIVHEGAHGWRWDVEKISLMQVTENLVDMMAGKIGRLSKGTQEVLKICACIGNRFDLETLAAVRGSSVDLALVDLTEAINEGMVSPLGDLYVFHHDRIQEAAYSLVTDNEKSKLHYKIGKLVLDAADETVLQKKLFYIVDQLNLGVDRIKGAEEQEQLAKLNLEAGRKAKSSAAYKPAFGYLQKGIDLLHDHPWQNQYDLTLALYSESTEAAYLMGDLDKMNALAETTIKYARTTLDRVNIYLSRINACMAREDYQGAINVALPVLNLLGFRLPEKPTQLDVGIELLKFKFALFGKKTEDILNMPRMTDPERLAAVKIIVSIGHAAFYMKPNMLAMVILRGMGAFRYGLAPEHGFAVASYGILLAAGLWDFKGSIEFGQLGLKLIEKLGARDQECRTIFVYNAIVRHWSFPLRETIPPLNEGYGTGMETGDLGFASFNLFLSDVHHLFSCKELSELDAIMSKNNQIIVGLNQKYNLTLQSLTWQAVLNLRGQCDDPIKVSGKAIDGEALLPAWENTNNRAALAVFWFVKTIMCVVYNDFALAVKASDQYKKYSASMLGIVINLYAVFCDSMARLFTYNDFSLSEKMKCRATIVMNQLKMKKWSASAPTNGLHMYYLVEALRSWLIQANTKKAESLFERAIHLCKKHEDIIIEGIASEYAIKFFQAAGNEKKANDYKAAAYSCYSRWGATGLLNKLNRMYPDIVTSAGKVSQDTTMDASFTTSNTLAATLDLSSVMKVSEAITSEIILERLLQKIMHMSLTNAGAQRGYLILDTDDELTIEVSEDADKNESLVMQSMALKDCHEICHAIVNYVHHSGKDIVLGNALYEGPFTEDPYIMRTKCKSILCSPFMHKGNIAGILYMENNLSTNAFTSERLNMLRMFSAQAAISIENARLFELATTDGMTKLYVHRYFQLLLDKEIKRSSRHNKKLSLIMMDIDNFKSFNDTYGHQLGDEVLKNVAQVVKKNTRAEDVSARYGGEEFVVILPETDTRQAMIAAEKIRASVAALEIPYEDKKLRVTISLGVSTFPEHATEKEALIHAADTALYTAKRAGKNCVSLCASGRDSREAD